MTNKLHCQQTNLHWKNNQPFSNNYEDIYFSRDSGLKESEHVFLDRNFLTQRFTNPTIDTFTIGETGFGTGLNFLASWKLWQDNSTGHSHLHFISVEKHPISRNDVRKALYLWSDIKDLTEQLINQYPQPSSGYHKLYFENGKITLTLMLGDAVECYSQLDAKVDAWFLDGFAPSKNPDMWSPELFKQVARLSKPGTTFSTFTAAGIVKRGLRDVGFEIKKVPGFGRKREMLTGTFKGLPADFPTLPTSPAWYRLPEKHSGERTAIVIGAGIAGCSTAYSLAQRGWKVKLIERNSQIAGEGSGNRQGALYAKLPVEPIPASRIHLSGFLYSSRFLSQVVGNDQTIWNPCGLLQIAASDKEAQKHKRLAESGNYPDSVVRFVSQQEASEIAGTAVTHSGLFFPAAGWVTPPALCNQLIQHPDIEVITDTEISEISYDDEQWQALTTDDKCYSAAICIVTSAAESLRFNQLDHLPLQKIRGQVSLTKEHADIPDLKMVLCSEGYISPAKEKRFCFGATFDLKDEATDIRESGHEHNLDKITEMAPYLAETLKSRHQIDGLDGRVGFRCASPDKLPLIGPAPNFAQYCDDYAALRFDAKTEIETPPTHHKGLFINIAHGSKGLISGLISGEIIAAMLENEPLPLERELIEKLNPARFIIKNLKRRTI